MGPPEICEERLFARHREFKQLRERHRRLGNARLVAAGISLALLWWVETALPDFTWHAVAALVVAFLASTRVLTKVEQAKAYALQAMMLYARPVLGDKRKPGPGSTDAIRLPEDHPFAHDVDIIDEGGLIDYLNIASTRSGVLALADMLLQPAAKEVILERQAAVKELKPQLDLRERLYVEGSMTVPYIRTEEIRRWAELDPVEVPRWFPVMCFLASCMVVILLLLLAFSPTPAGSIALGGSFLTELGLWKIGRKFMTGQGVEAERIHLDLTALRSLVKVLEERDFQAPYLRNLADKLRSADQLASHLLGQFCRIINLFEARRNQLVGLFGPLVLYETQAALAMERWKAKHGRTLPMWIEAIAGFEAYSSLSCFAFEHPQYSFPAITDKQPVFTAEGLAHPILPGGAVANDVELDGQRSILMVSGANMAGKSTLLRTIGVSMALTYAGAPVRARAMTISALQTVASIRVKDSLRRGESRFAAELGRIRLVLESVRKGRPTLVLIDELFAGTNSYDRYAGAVALSEFLLGCDGSLAVLSTHDRNVTQWAEDNSDRITNVHFRDLFLEGEMYFDYKLQRGPAMRGNALELMKQAGLPMPEKIPPLIM